MAIAIVEELWARIRAAIDDKIVAAEDAADRAEAAAQSTATGVQADTVGRLHLTPELRGEIDGKAAVSHDHTIGQVAGLQDELDGKADADHQHSWGDVTGKPATYPPESHTHSQSEVEGLEAALAGKASTDHTHPEYATTAAVEARTPEIRIVSSPELATSPGVLYVVRED